MVRWRSETIVQWIDRFEAPLAELEVARDGLNPYTEDELMLSTCGSRPSQTTSVVRKYSCLGMWKLVAYKML
jgi:hypothetical protein